MQHSRYCPGDFSCPRVVTTCGSQGRCVPTWGGSQMRIPRVRGADPSAGCRQDHAGHVGHQGPPVAHPTMQPGMGPWVQGSCGSPRLRQSCCCCHVHTPWWHRGSGGLISCSLLNSSKCRNLFFHCLTPPAGELTQRKVRAGPCQGSVVERKELY